MPKIYQNRLKRYAGNLLNFSGINYISRRANSKKTIILLYHAIIPDESEMQTPDFADLCVRRHIFEKHVAYLKDNFNIISLDDLINGAYFTKDDRPNAIITFDDGFLNNFTEAFPVLKTHEVKATFFMTSSFVGGNELLWFNKVERLIYCSRKNSIGPFTALPRPLNILTEKDRIKAIKLIINIMQELPYVEFKNALSEIETQAGRPEALTEEYPFKPMKWEHAVEMAKDPNITIGSHGKNHYPLSTLPQGLIRDELESSKYCIEQKINKRVNHLSCPHGFYNDSTIRIARDCKYLTALTTAHGFNDDKTDFYQLRRNEIGNSGDMEIFLAVACGSWDFLRGALGRWKACNRGY